MLKVKMTMTGSNILQRWR